MEDQKSNQLPGKTSQSYIAEDLNRISESILNFVMTDPEFREKVSDIKEERKRAEEFKRYLIDNNAIENVSRGFLYLLKDPCDYVNSVETFRIHAYDEREGIKKLEEKRKELSRLVKKYESVLKKVVALSVKKISWDRNFKASSSVPKVVARSSGTPSNNYVFGYGYMYGVGYTDSSRSSTAPGFELAATKHVQELIKFVGPIKGRQNFDKVYKDIFDYKLPPKQKKGNISLSEIDIFDDEKQSSFLY